MGSAWIIFADDRKDRSLHPPDFDQSGPVITNHRMAKVGTFKERVRG